MVDFDAKARTWDDDPEKLHRARTLAQAVAEAVPLTAQSRVLEYGAGTGQLSLALAPRVGSVLLADASAGMVDVARERLSEHGLDPGRAVRLDLLADPAPGERFDLVVSAMTLHHVPDVPRLLRVLRGLLDQGGWVALADLDSENGLFHDEPFDGHHGFDRDDLATQLSEAGYTEVKFSTPYAVTKEVDGQRRDFPLFLATARRGSD